MSIRIMEQARESMLERRAVVQESLDRAKEVVAAAQNEIDEIDISIKEQEAAIDRARNPKKAKRRPADKSRPYQRHDPLEGTKIHQVWKTILDYDGVVSIGIIGTKTGLPANVVKTSAADLVNRDLIERVSDGFFQSKPTASG